MPQTPRDRNALMEAIAAIIGWGISASTVENYAEKFEALGVEFIPSALIPKDVVNPYARPQRKQQT